MAVKVNFKVKVENIYGEPIQVVDEAGKVVEDARTAMIEWHVINAILSTDPREQVPGKEMLERYELAKKLANSSGDIELSVEEAALVNKLMEKNSRPLIFGQFKKILEGTTETG